MSNSRRYFQIILLFLTFLLHGASSVLAQESFVVPAFTGPIVDEAHMVSRPVRQKLLASLHRIKGDTGLQLALLTVPELHGLTIEEASIKITDQWKLGAAKEDNGALLILAQKERKIRIEVGQGLEGVLTDVDTKRMIEKNIAPLLRSGNIDAAVTMGLYSIAQHVNGEIDMTPYFEGSNLQSKSKNSRKVSWWEIVIYGFIFLVLISTRQGRDLLMLILMFSRGGGGGGSSGGGFGDYGGGGGGFSGGGASGDW